MPAILIATEPMRAIVESFAPTLGLTDYPAIEVPHPVSPLDDDALRKLAVSVLDAAEARLTESVG